MPIESRSPTAYGRYPALSRRRLGVFSYVSELYAGERLRLAGYSSGTGVCARGGCSARLCVPVAALCHRLMAGLAVLSRRFASAHGWPCGSVAAFCLGSRPTLRSCRGALPSAHGWPCGSVAAFYPRLMAGLAVLSPRFAIGSRLSFSSLRKKRRLAIACVPVPPGRDRHSRILQCRRGYLPLAGSLWVCAFLYGDPDGSTTGVRLYEKKRRIGWALLSLWIYDSS